ncbi:MAG: vitamin K epoxide reductase family protein [Patescibacteria group bacterium]
MNIILGLIGFCIAAYIAHKKHKKTEHFVCPMRGNCTAVVHSDYSKFFGIPVEILGMIYYGLVVLGYLGHTITYESLLLIPLGLLSMFAVLFSVYLTWVQVFVLRKLCTWCLISAFITCVIFVLFLKMFMLSSVVCCISG